MLHDYEIEANNSKQLKNIKVNTKITKKGKIIFTNLDTID